MRDLTQVKAVFTDVDGTLLNSEHRVTPRTREQIHRLTGAKIPFIIVSARSPSGIYPILRRNGFRCPLIAYSGALIMDEDRRILYSREIERGLASEIERFLDSRREELIWNLYSGDTWLAPDRCDPRVMREERIVEAQAEEGTVKSLPAGASVNKFLCICEPGTVRKIEREVKEAFPGVAVARSSEILLEIMAQGVSKAKAVARVCEHLGIDPRETIALGDNCNDVEMLETVGRGYVMGNAPAEILGRFAYHTADNDHDGIAEILEQIPEL